MTKRAFLVIVVAVALASAGCAHDDAMTTPVPTSATVSASPAPSSSSAPACSTAPHDVAHRPAVPPVPVLTGVRPGTHPGYDRIVFDLDGALPGYAVHYVDEIPADPSDRTIAVPGKVFLLVVLTPAQAHRSDGSATVS